MALSLYWYPVGHFLLYAAVLRHLRAFSTEGAMFLYHAGSAALLAVILFGSWNAGISSERLTEAVGVLSFHGIYSLSFLELWWLSDGGYSLRILDRVDRSGSQAEVTDLESLGSAKKSDRLNSLKTLGLARAEGEKTRLTGPGRLFAFFLFLVAWPSQVLKTG